jgi:hypothetical protein
MWHDIRTKFHEDRFCLRNLRGCNVGITDDRDFFNYAAEMGSGGVIYIPRSMTIGSGM